MSAGPFVVWEFHFCWVPECGSPGAFIGVSGRKRREARLESSKVKRGLAEFLGKSFKTNPPVQAPELAFCSTDVKLWKWVALFSAEE